MRYRVFFAFLLSALFLVGEGTLQPGGGDVHGVVETGFVTLLQHHFCRIAGRVGVHELYSDFICYFQVAHLLGGLDGEHADIWVIHVAVIKGVTLTNQRLVLVGKELVISQEFHSNSKCIAVLNVQEVLYERL